MLRHTGNLKMAILALRPDLVHLDQAEAGYTDDPLKMADRLFAEGLRSLSENGVLGDPEGATSDFGFDYLDAMSSIFTQHIRQARDSWI